MLLPRRVYPVFDSVAWRGKQCDDLRDICLTVWIFWEPLGKLGALNILQHAEELYSIVMCWMYLDVT